VRVTCVGLFIGLLVMRLTWSHTSDVLRLFRRPGLADSVGEFDRVGINFGSMASTPSPSCVPPDDAVARASAMAKICYKKARIAD